VGRKTETVPVTKLGLCAGEFVLLAMLPVSVETGRNPYSRVAIENISAELSP